MIRILNFGMSLLILLTFTATMPGRSIAQPPTDSPASAPAVKIVSSEFAKKLSEDGRIDDVVQEFEPSDPIHLYVVLNGKVEEGVLACSFMLGKEELSSQEFDLAETSKGDAGRRGNTSRVFTLESKRALSVSSDYRAVVKYDGQSLGIFKFEVIKPTQKDEPKVSVDEMESPTHSASKEKGTKELVQTLLCGTAFVEGVDENGEVWRGTAWLLDREKRLLVTNDHVANAGLHDSSIGTVKELHLYFPAYRDGRVIHDTEHYARNVEPIKVQVIYGDEQKDLALLQAEYLPEKAQALKLADTPVDLGDSLYSLGGIPAGSEGFWIYTSGTVRAVYRRRLATGYRAETVEADMETNQGNSGGPVVNNRGELVAVVEGHMTSARSVSLYIDLSEVKTFLDEALPLVAPQTVEQFVKRGEHHYNGDRLDQALADFTEVLRREPGHAYAMSSRGWIFYKKGDSATSLAAFDAAIKADPTMLYAYRGRAMVHLDAGEPETAITDLTHAITNATDKEELGEFYNQRGVAYSRLSDTRAALADFERAIDSNPEHAWAHANRGNMLIDLGEYQTALSSLSTARKLDPNESEFPWLMGRASHRLGNHEQALQLYTEAIEVNPYEADYLIEQAKCLAALSRYADAGKALRGAIEIDENNDWIRNKVGIVAFDLGAYKMAYEEFRQASELDPNYSYYWYNRGHASFKMRDFETAHQELSRAIRLQEDHDFYSLRGNTNSILGRNRDAVDDFERAKKIEPGTFRKYNSKYFRISNATSEPLRVYLQYQTKGTDGEYHWYPSSGGPLYFDFAPGEESGIREGQQVIHGSAFRIWAEGQNTGKQYLDYKDSPYIVCGEVGYLTSQGEPEVEVYTFEEE